MTPQQARIIFNKNDKGELQLGIDSDMCMTDILFCIAMLQQRLLRGDFTSNGKIFKLNDGSGISNIEDIEK